MMQTYKLRFKPLGKCEDVLIEARDAEYAEAVGRKYCTERRVEFVYVQLNTVASEAILTDAEKQQVEQNRKTRAARADKEQKALRKQQAVIEGTAMPA